jgi:hypothetical protein
MHRAVERINEGCGRGSSCGAVAACLGLCIGTASAQAPQADFAARWVAPDETLTLRIDAAQQAQWRQWRVFAGTSEVTALVRLAEPGLLEIRPLATAWLPGQGELAVYDGQTWAEVVRWPLKVLTPGGFESSEFAPRLNLQGEGRVQERRSDGRPLTPRGRHADAALAAGLDWKGTRGATSSEAALNIVGNSDRGKALRQGDKGVRAPKVDLADYRVAVGVSGHKIELGHLSAGSNALLAQGFGSRGVGLMGRLGENLDVTLHALRGSGIVGWDDPSGLEEPRHRVHLMSLGAELAPSRPGALRAELSLLDASILPQAAFNTGTVPDAERSSGLGLRLAGALASGRLSGEMMFARSRFTNPFDPQLAAGGELRPVTPVSRNAASARAQWQLLKQADLAGQPLDLTLNVKWDRAAPLYRTPAAQVTADEEAMRLGMQAALGGASAQLQVGTRVDNLARISNILRTRTDDGTLVVNLPLPAWLGEKERPEVVWPAVAWTGQRTHQRAVNAPDTLNSGIAATHRPDQITASQQVNLSWSLGAGSIAYGLTRSTVDNRQIGRESADFDRLAQQGSVNWSFGEALRLGTTLSRGRQRSAETGLLSRTLGGTLQLDWQPTDRWSVGASVSHDGADDSRDEASRTNRAAQLQLSRRFDVAGIDKPLPGQAFIRLGYQFQSEHSTPFATTSAWRAHWIDIGLAISFF